MKNLTYLFYALLFTLFTQSIRAQYIPPDIFGDSLSTSIGFWPNLGQIVDLDSNYVPDILFHSEGSNPKLYMQQNSTISFVTEDQHPDSNEITAYRVDFHPIGKNVNLVNPIYSSVRDYHNNYYFPHTGSGITEVTGYNRIIYEEVWNKVDMHFYAGRSGQKIAFVVKPGGNPDQIAFSFNGQDSLNVLIDGFLRLHLGNRELKFPEAIAYQDINGTPSPLGWGAVYDDSNNEVQLSIEQYDDDFPLILLMGLPPTANPSQMGNLEWSTFAGSSLNDRGYSSDIDENGGLFVGGITSGLNFPTTPGAHMEESDGSINGFIMSFDENRELKWSTYFGGSETDEVRSISYANNSESLYITGYTFSPDFPTIFTPGAFNGLSIGSATSTDAFLSKFEASNGILEHSAYIGSLGTERGFGLKINGDSKFLVGYASSGLQTIASGLQHTQIYGGGSSDALIMEFGSNDELLWRTYLGGSLHEFGYSLEFDEQDNLYIIGATGSNDFPTLTFTGGYNQSTYNGGTDMFINKFNADRTLIWSTFIGGNGQDFPSESDGLAISNDRIYISGFTLSNLDLPTADAGGYFDNSFNGGYDWDGILLGFDVNSHTLDWGTYLGGSEWDQVEGITIDDFGNLYATGQSEGNGFPYVAFSNLYFDENPFNDPEAFISVFTEPSMELNWSTSIGNNDDGGLSLDVFQNDRLFMVGFGNTGYPTIDPGSPAYFTAMNQGTYDCVISEFKVNSLSTKINPILDVLDLFTVTNQDGIWYFKFPNEVTGILRIYDAQGKLLTEEKLVHSNFLVLEYLELAIAPYIAQFTNEDGFVSKVKFVNSNKK